MARYIDADLLKEQMESVCMGIMAGTDSYNAPLKTIDNAPTADVRENVHAHWEDEQKGRWIYAKCSACGAVKDVKSAFCPNCGADMRERREE